MIVDKKRDKHRAKNTSADSKEVTFVILKNHANVPIRKERLSSTSKARKGPAEISLWKRAGCQTESKALEKSILAEVV